jgi:hypothetical protein
LWKWTWMSRWRMVFVWCIVFESISLWFLVESHVSDEEYEDFAYWLCWIVKEDVRVHKSWTDTFIIVTVNRWIFVVVSGLS